MQTRLYIAATLAALALLAPVSASAGDFHDMWGGTWRAHTAPFDGWQRVTRTLVPAISDGEFTGLFYEYEDCQNNQTTEVGEDGATRVYDNWLCARTGEVQVAGDQSRLSMYASLLHELGHARDWMAMGDAERARFANTMGYNPNPEAWWEPLKSRGWRSPGELFAEANEFCGLSGKQRRDMGYVWGLQSGRLTGGVYRWRPTREQARKVCGSLR